MICQQIFSILALVVFLLEILFKSVSKSCFFALASRSGFGAAIPVVVMYKKASLYIFFPVKACCV